MTISLDILVLAGLAVVLVGVAVVLLGVKIFFVKGGRFPNTHIHDNPSVRSRGISCPRDGEFCDS